MVRLTGGRKGGDEAMEQIAAQRRILDDVARSNRSAWAWFPPIFVIAFSLLSFAGTYIGLRDIIATGDLRAGWVGDALVFALVALATGAMVYFLRHATIKFWSVGGFAAFAAYLVLLFFSVTFGFAFYWGRLEANNQAIAGAQGQIESLSDQIQTSAFTLQSTAAGLTSLSGEFRRLAEQERTVGGTCGDGSSGGYGPRTRHRERRAQEIEAYVGQIQPRFAVVEGAVSSMEGELEKIGALTDADAASGTDRAAARAIQFKESRQAARAAALEINALAADPALLSLAGVFKQWGVEYQDPALVRRDDPEGRPYKCVQPAVGQLLIGAAAQLENLPQVSTPDLPAYAGPAATREAVFRMLNSVGAVLTGDFSGGFGGGAGPGGPPPGPIDPSGAGPATVAFDGSPADAAGPLLGAGAASVEGLREQDRFPLAVALIIDALLFAFVLIERPGRRYFDRMNHVAEEARHAFQPLRMVALREALEQDREWRLLNEFRFDIGDRTFIAAPRGPIEGDERFRVLMLRDVLTLFQRNNVVRHRPMSEQKAKALLQQVGLPYDPPGAEVEEGERRDPAKYVLNAIGRDDLARFPALDFYEFRPEGMERLLMTSMADVDKREADYRPPQREGIWARWFGGRDQADAAARDEPQATLAKADAPWMLERPAPPAPLEDAAPERRPAPRAVPVSQAQPDRTLALDEADRVGAEPAGDDRSRWPWRRE